MKILLSWIKEFLEVSLPPESLARELTLAGDEVTALTKVEGDWMIEMEITPNRPDLLSHLGIARELAAILGRPFKIRKGFLKKLLPIPFREADAAVEIKNPEDCRLYVGIAIKGVQIKESPPAFVKRLRTLGVNPVNNVVDATNLCLFELGQPLHAFDLDRLEGRKIIVRRASVGETLSVIDGQKILLTPEQLVIADAKRPVALAGVMGGKETEITPKTQSVFLESAWFAPRRIRRGRFLAKLQTESSYRFERGVDIEMVPAAAARAARLIVELAGGEISEGPIQAGQPEDPRPSIRLVPRRAQETLGMPILPRKQRQILTRLGCQVAGGPQGFRVTPPSFRGDLKIAEDLYEELARLWGYERCAAATEIFQGDPWFDRQRRIRQFLVGFGLQEIMTYSLVHPEDHPRIGLIVGSAPLPLQNPVSLDHSVLRQTLLIGALKSVALNLNRKSGQSFALFELGHIYAGGSLEPSEKRALSILMAGTPAPQWGRRPSPLGIFHLKGVLEELFGRLGVGATNEVKENGQPGHLVSPALLLGLEGKSFGWAGVIDPKVLAAFDIPEEIPVSYAELDLELFAGLISQTMRVEPLPRIPPVARDLAVVVGEQIPYAELRHTIEEAGKPLLHNVDLFDLYKGPQVPPGKKSLAFRLLFSDGDRTLREEEISAALQRVIERLQGQFQAAIR